MPEAWPFADAEESVRAHRMDKPSETPSLAPAACIKRYFRLNLEDISYVRFLVEAYEGILQMSSFPSRAEVEWNIPTSQIEQADSLAEALGREITFVPIPPPEDWPGQGTLD